MASYDIEARNVSVAAHNHTFVIVSLDSNASDLANALGVKDAVAHLDNEEILDEIGVEYVKNYFGLVEEE